MVDLDLHDVLVLGHRPIGTVEACPAVMHRVLAPQPREIGVPDVVLVEPGFADVDRLERDAVGLGVNRVVKGWAHRSTSRSGNISAGPRACARSARRAPR